MFFSLKARINTGILCILASCIAAGPLCAEEARRPVFSYRDASGSVQAPDLASHKLTAVHFWATWCVPCIAEVPEVDAAQKAYGDKGFKVLAISLDGSIEKVQAFYADHKITSLVPIIDNGATSIGALKVRALPVTIFFDRKGEEIARVEGPLHWLQSPNREFIEKQLR